MVEFFTIDLGFGWALWELTLFIGLVLSAMIIAYYFPTRHK